MAKDETVVVALTHVVLKESINSDIFWERSEEVVESLETHPGFLGYSLRFVVLGDEAWTMTVWEDQKSLQDFVASGVHGKAMLQGIGSVDGGGFHNFESKVGDVPPSWEVAETLLKQEGRSYGY